MTKEHHHPLERIKRKKNCHWGTSIHCKVCRDQAFEGFCHNMIKYPSHTLFYIWYLKFNLVIKNFDQQSTTVHATSILNLPWFVTRNFFTQQYIMTRGEKHLCTRHPSDRKQGRFAYNHHFQPGWFMLHKVHVHVLNVYL